MENGTTDPATTVQKGVEARAPRFLAVRTRLKDALSRAKPGEGYGETLFIPLTIAAIMLYLALTNEYFLTAGNINNLVLQSVVMGIVAFGSTFVLMAGELDLSVSSGTALVSVTSAVVMVNTGNVPLGLVVGLATGIILGIANGLVVTKLKVPSFVGTFGTLVIAHGIALDMTNGGTIFGLPDGVGSIVNSSFLGLRWMVWWMVIFFAILLYIERKTVLGIQILAVGGNPEASRLTGIRVERVHMACFLISGISMSIAGLALMLRVESGQPNAVQLLNLEAVAAIVIGGTSLYGGQGSVVRSLWGVLLLVTLKNAMDLENIDPDWKQMATGVVLIAALSVDTLRRRLRQRRAEAELRRAAEADIEEQRGKRTVERDER